MLIIMAILVVAWVWSLSRWPERSKVARAEADAARERARKMWGGR